MDKNLIKQSNKITLAKQDLTKRQRDCFYLIAREINNKRTKGELVDGKNIHHLKISVADIKELCHVKNISEYSELMRSLMTKSIGVSNEKGFVWMSIVVESKYKTGDPYINVYVLDDLIPFFLDVLNKFTIYNIDTVIRFRSAYTQRFYELCCMFASKKKFTMRVDTIRERFNITGYPNFAIFKAKVLNVARDEMNKFYEEGKSNIKFDYTPSHYTGRQVDELEFTVTSRTKTKETSEYICKIIAIISSICNKNIGYMDYINIEIRKLIDSEAERLYARLKSLKEQKELNFTLLNIILSDYGINYNKYKKDAINSIMNDISKKKYDSKYITESEAKKCMYAAIGSNGERRIVDYINKKIERGKPLHDYEEYFKIKYILGNGNPEVVRNVEERKKKESDYGYFGMDYI